MAAEQFSVATDNIADIALRSNKRTCRPVVQQMPLKAVRHSLERGVADVADHHVGLMLPMKELIVDVDITSQAAARNEATLVALGNWHKWEPVFPTEVLDEWTLIRSPYPYSMTALVADQLLLVEFSEGYRLLSVCR